MSTAGQVVMQDLDITHADEIDGLSVVEVGEYALRVEMAGYVIVIDAHNVQHLRAEYVSARDVEREPQAVARIWMLNPDYRILRPLMTTDMEASFMAWSALHHGKPVA